MIDLRKIKRLDISNAKCLKEETTYLFKDNISGKDLIAKFIGYYNDEFDQYLIDEYKKLSLLSSEPEIGTVYYLATSSINNEDKNCYVMDFIKGKTIGDIIKDNSKYDFDYLLDLIIQISSGLEKSHNYEITHGDLHEENVMIDNYGYIKIIDFAFWGKKIDFQKNVIYDIECFNEIIGSLSKKCQDFDKSKFEIILNLCSKIKTFKGLNKELKLLEEVIFDLNLLEPEGKEIISSIINEIPFEIHLSKVISETNVDIPYNPEFEQTEKEKYYMDSENSNKGLKLKYSDQRMDRINRYINNLFIRKLHQLKQAGLIDWEVWVSNPGKKFIGPYKYNFQIFLTPKLLKWKKINNRIQFLPIVKDKTLTELLIINCT